MLRSHRPSLALVTCRVTCRVVCGVVLTSVISGGLNAATWPRFRGPNGVGVAETEGLPIHCGPEQNVVWKTLLPPGHSSPVLSENHIFLTATEDGRLFTICIERESEKILWRRPGPRRRNNNPRVRARSRRHLAQRNEDGREFQLPESRLSGSHAARETAVAPPLQYRCRVERRTQSNDAGLAAAGCPSNFSHLPLSTRRAPI
jgi:hypothetical protein